MKDTQKKPNVENELWFVLNRVTFSQIREIIRQLEWYALDLNTPKGDQKKAEKLVRRIQVRYRLLQSGG